MKNYNEYGDQLTNIEISIKLKELGLDKYSPECFVQSDTDEQGEIFDDWTGLIGDGYKFHSYRYTLSYVRKWVRDNYNLNVFIGFRPNTKKWDSHSYDMNLNGREYIKAHPLKDHQIQEVYDDYETALEFGIIKALQYIIDQSASDLS